jgi:hypothetical protein
MKSSPLANSSLDLGTVNATVTPLPHDPARIRPVSLKVAMLLVVLFGTRLFAQSEKLVWLITPNGRAYTTICTDGHCGIKEVPYSIDLVDPQYVHDEHKERKTFCKANNFKRPACSKAFRRELAIQRLLQADRVVSSAGGMSAMSREQAEQLVEGIKQ